jgi:hypothetical protein
MIHLSTIVLIAAKTVTLLCGVILTTLTFRAYRRTDATAMRALSLGIGLVTVGGVLAGTLNQVFDTSIRISMTVESVFIAGGFLVMTYSLYAEQPPEDVSSAKTDH